ncbi:hypothetical protein F2P81_019013 [Scophthalmus maximus]|uniref:Uncharacterized protein n=1 Tax=Scophthalmus maximus TaxID=52904 RepID=A0A6A4SC80_SCOMX|nr:hypothetical protein F2P81_019013 [Scophthalmus maximus]
MVRSSIKDRLHFTSCVITPADQMSPPTLSSQPPKLTCVHYPAQSDAVLPDFVLPSKSESNDLYICAHTCSSSGGMSGKQE